MSYKKILSADKKLAKVIAKTTIKPLAIRKNVFLHLVKAITGQQLSTKAAATIYQRFLNLFDGKAPTPPLLLQIKIEQLRSVGLSYAKANYIHNIAQFWIDNNLSDKWFAYKPNKEIIEKLTQIKGVGCWTVEMLLMFTLAREDVFAVDDLAIQQSMVLLYNWQHLSVKEQKQAMLAKAKTWQPYQTYACLHLWQWRGLGYV